MRFHRILVHRLTSLFRRDRLEAEMREEMKFHIEKRTADYIAEGESATDARRAAQLRFGNVGSLHERARDAWGWRWLESARRDAKSAWRQFSTHRSFTAVAMLTLAVAIGANTAIFSAVYALMLKPLPYPEPGRIVEIYHSYPKTSRKETSNVVTYLDYKEHAKSFSDFGIWTTGPMMVEENIATERLLGAGTSADFFNVLGIKPIIGQFFTLENSRPNADDVVVLTQSFWESQFQEDPTVLGRTMRIDGNTVTIIGVAPRALESFDARVRFVLPYTWDAAKVNPHSRHMHNLRLFARLRPDAAVESAQAEADTIEKIFYDSADPQMRAFIDGNGSRTLVRAVQSERLEPLQPTLVMLQGGALFVLLIGCVNIANLLLARATARQSEFSIRAALGASRGTIARQVLLETLLLTTLGTLLGVGVGWCGVGVLNHYRENLMSACLPFTLDGRVLGFTVFISTGAALLISIAPIAHVLRTDLMGPIHRGSYTSSGRFGARALSSVLVVAQVAIALVLLAGAGLLIHSFIKALGIDAGFDPKGVMTGRIAIPPAYWASDTVANLLRDRVQLSMKEIPGVSNAALGFALPFRGGLLHNGLALESDVLPPDSPRPSAYRVFVSPEYFDTLRLNLVVGRFFEPADLAPGRSVFVVDQSFAEKYFPSRSAIDGRFTFGRRPTKDSDWPTIVGVVRNVPHNGVEQRDGSPFIYQLINGRSNGLTLFLRTTRPISETIGIVRAKLHAIDPSIVLYETSSLEDAIGESFGQRRAIMLLLVAFAAFALFLSALGIYGVLSYDVSQRTREIGVRGAIGASPGQIIGLIMQQGLWKTGIGLVIGLIGALLLSRAMRSLLFDLSVTDPWSYAIVPMVLLFVAAIASYLPARRAAGINPTEALRTG